MQTEVLRQRLHQLIDSIEDKKLRALYILFENDLDTGEQRRNLILAEREQYHRGEGMSFTWEEVKQMAIDKEKRNAI